LPNVKLMRETLSRGDDTKAIILVEGVRDGRPGKRQMQFLSCFLHSHIARFHCSNSFLTLIEIAKCMGSDISANAIQLQINRVVRKDANKILECIEAGGDPKDLNLAGEVKGSQVGKGQAFLHSTSCTSRFHFVILYGTHIDVQTEIARAFWLGLRARWPQIPSYRPHQA